MKLKEFIELTKDMDRELELCYSDTWANVIPITIVDKYTKETWGDPDIELEEFILLE